MVRGGFLLALLLAMWAPVAFASDAGQVAPEPERSMVSPQVAVGRAFSLPLAFAGASSTTIGVLLLDDRSGHGLASIALIGMGSCGSAFAAGAALGTRQALVNRGARIGSAPGWIAVAATGGVLAYTAVGSKVELPTAANVVVVGIGVVAANVGGVGQVVLNERGRNRLLVAAVPVGGGGMAVVGLRL